MVILKPPLKTSIKDDGSNGGNAFVEKSIAATECKLSPNFTQIDEPGLD